MEDAIDTAIRRDIGGDAQRIHAKQTVVDAIRFKHLLMPVWIGSPLPMSATSTSCSLVACCS